MAIKIANNAQGTLEADISASDTTISVVNAGKFPSVESGSGEYFYITIFQSGNHEIFKVTGVSGNDFTVVRGQDGTTARSFTAGAGVELRINAAVLRDMYNGFKLFEDPLDVYGIEPNHHVTGRHDLVQLSDYNSDTYVLENGTNGYNFADEHRWFYPWKVEFNDMSSNGYHIDSSGFTRGRFHHMSAARIEGRTKSAFGGSFNTLDVYTRDDSTNLADGSDPEKGDIRGINVETEYWGDADVDFFHGIRNYTYSPFGSAVNFNSVRGITNQIWLTENDAVYGNVYGILTDVTVGGDTHKIYGSYVTIDGIYTPPATFGDEDDHGYYLYKGVFEEDRPLDYGIHLTGDKFNKLDGKLGIGVTPTASSPMLEVKGPVELHWSSNSEGTSPDDIGYGGATIGVQTRRLQTTDRGIHIGDDLIGTITSGDLQNNADVDYGVLIGRDSTNLGSNNFGHGYQMYFGADTASNWATGSQCKFYGSSTNSMAHGGNVVVGNSTDVNESADSSFVGGYLSQATNDYSFTWAQGAVQTVTNAESRAINKGKGSVLFGLETYIDDLSFYTMVGGSIGFSPNYKRTQAQNSDASLVWGKGTITKDSNYSLNVGWDNFVDGAMATGAVGQGHNVKGTHSFVAGLNHTVEDTFNNCGSLGDSNTLKGSNSMAFGSGHLTEGDGAVSLGKDCNAIGIGGICAGAGLKTPLFEPVGGGDYVWDHHSVVVGGFNDEAHKYITKADNSEWVTNHRFVVGTGTASDAKANGFIVTVATADFSGIIMPALAASTAHSSNSAAKDAGVPVGGLYRDTNNNIKIVV